MGSECGHTAELGEGHVVAGCGQVLLFCGLPELVDERASGLRKFGGAAELVLRLYVLVEVVLRIVFSGVRRLMLRSLKALSRLRERIARLVLQLCLALVLTSKVYVLLQVVPGPRQLPLLREMLFERSVLRPH